MQPDRRDEQQERDRPLGQHAEPGRDGPEVPPAEAQAVAADRLERRQQRERDPEREQPVEDEQPAHAGEARGDHQQQPAPERGPLAQAAAAEQVDGQDRQVDAQRRHQPGRRLGHAEAPGS